MLDFASGGPKNYFMKIVKLHFFLKSRLTDIIRGDLKFVRSFFVAEHLLAWYWRQTTLLVVS